MNHLMNHMIFTKMKTMTENQMQLLMVIRSMAMYSVAVEVIIRTLRDQTLQMNKELWAIQKVYGYMKLVL